MTIKNPHRTGRLVALAVAAAALSATIVPMTASASVPSRQLTRPASAAVLPAALPVLPAAARLRAVLPLLNPTDLCARAGSTTMPDGVVVQVWGYEVGNCTGVNTITKPGGPVITVNAGTPISIALHNGLGIAAEATSLLFQGQAIQPDTTGAAGSATVTGGGTVTYTFTPNSPGTYLYEAGLTPNSQHQVAMGLYGALIVRPSGAPTQAYGNVATTFQDEGVLVLGDIDTALNNSVNKAAFDMRNFKAKYATINGKAYSAADPITTNAGNKLLLRYVNAGITYHSMSLLGASQQVIAYDGNMLTYARSIVAETFGPGQTADTLVSTSASTPDGTRLAVYDASLLLNNSRAAGFGGMMTFITVAGGITTDTTGPLFTGVSATPNPSNGVGNVTLSATAADPSNVASAQYRIDGGAAIPFAGTFGSLSVALSATIDATALSQGSHNLQVQATDGAAIPNTSGWSSVTLVIDRVGPAIVVVPVSSLSLTPNPSNGTTNVALHAAASDVATGGQNVTEAEYTIDGVATTAITVSIPAPTVSLDATIAAATVAALTPGSHAVAVRAKDALGNWGATASITLMVDNNVGPVTSSVVVSYLNQTPAAVRVTAHVSDTGTGNSNVIGAEGFIDVVPANTTVRGFPLFPADGLFDSPAENVTADIPAATLASLSAGSHTVRVRGMDAQGAWGATASVTLVVDTTLPIISAASVSPTPTNGRTTQLRATATDAGGSLLLRAEWFTGVDPGVGNATLMAIAAQTGANNLTATIDVTTWTEGNYTLSVRVRDGAGNWSAIRTATVRVTHPFYFSTSGNTNPPGLGGTADDADVLSWNGTTFVRTRDLRVGTVGLPATADVDGLYVVDATHFYVSFSGTTTAVPGITGGVQDEDIVFYNAGTWSVYFDGTTKGLTSNNLDVDDFAIVGGTLYFSTTGNSTPPGALGTADASDIYRWNGGLSYTRVWDASTHGVPTGNNLVGLSMIDTTHFFVLFDADLDLADYGGVTAGDILYYDNGVYTLYYDGTTLNADPATIPDAIDVP